MDNWRSLCRKHRTLINDESVNKIRRNNKTAGIRIGFTAVLPHRPFKYLHQISRKNADVLFFCVFFDMTKCLLKKNPVVWQVVITLACF